MISIIKNNEVYATEQEINAHADKLTFNTREEYFEWVKQWKEVYNNVVLWHRIEKLWSRSNYPAFVDGEWTWKPLPGDKALYKRNKSNQLETLVTMQSSELREKLTQQIKDEYNYVPAYGEHSFYNLIHYLLAVRKASKIRAAKKREERLSKV